MVAVTPLFEPVSASQLQPPPPPVASVRVVEGVTPGMAVVPPSKLVPHAAPGDVICKRGARKLITIGFCCETLWHTWAGR